MQMDSIIAVVLSIGTTIFSVGLAWGLISQRVTALEDKVQSNKIDSEKKHDSFVTLTHFEAVTNPIRIAIETIQKDIKEILKVVRNQ